MRRALALGSLLWLAACVASPAADPVAVQEQAQSAWQTGWHGTWDLAWEEAPLAGPVLFEAWRAEGGRLLRLEILDAPAPQLVGQTCLRRDDAVTRYNRLDPSPPVSPSAGNRSCA
ncbi:MAG: hypothetical protein D6796_15200, partial [Caldilineae bacterium]